ncbi:MAG: hypothetical protein C5S49_07725 [Candidatus Methanogaster sp.]|nr:MAG: hypothetical protein C5S49_07725 [ANME-2 cluster archaeon]
MMLCSRNADLELAYRDKRIILDLVKVQIAHGWAFLTGRSVFGNACIFQK